MTDRPIDRESPSEERCARCGRSRNAAIHEGKCACGCRQSEHWADGGECVNDCDCLCFHPAPAPVSDPKGEGHDIVGQAFCRCCRRVVVDDLPCMPQFKWTAPDSHHWMGDVKIDAPMEPADRRHDIYVTDNGRVFDGCDAGCNGKEIILSRRSTVTPEPTCASGCGCTPRYSLHDGPCSLPPSEPTDERTEARERTPFVVDTCCSGRDVWHVDESKHRHAGPMKKIGNQRHSTGPNTYMNFYECVACHERAWVGLDADRRIVTERSDG
jgi:hypothetical protein